MRRKMPFETLTMTKGQREDLVHVRKQSALAAPLVRILVIFRIRLCSLLLEISRPYKEASSVLFIIHDLTLFLLFLI